MARDAPVTASRSVAEALQEVCVAPEAALAASRSVAGALRLMLLLAAAAAAAQERRQFLRIWKIAKARK